MKKILLLILCMYSGVSAYAQMATTTVGGKVVSNDDRKICFRTVAKRLDVNLDPKANGGKYRMEKMALNDDGTTVNGEDLHGVGAGGSEFVYPGNTPSYCTYKYVYDEDYQQYVGRFQYENVLTGKRVVNLFCNLNTNGYDEGKLIDNGKLIYHNFVIRTLNVDSPVAGMTVGSDKQGARYCIQFCQGSNNVLKEMFIYSDNVKVVHLDEFMTPEEIGRINTIWLTTASGGTHLSATVDVAECYLISGYDMNDTDNGNLPLGSHFYDMDNQYTGNAYLHPSYFIKSNYIDFNNDRGVVTVKPVDKHNLADENSSISSAIGTNVGVNSAIFGDNGVNPSSYVDLSQYDKLILTFTHSDNFYPRLFFNVAGEGNSKVQDLIIGKGNGETMDYVDEDVNEGVTTWTIHLNVLKKYLPNGHDYIHLHTIKTALDGEGWVNVSEARLIKKSDVKNVGNLILSVPFEGMDMEDVTYVTIDHEDFAEGVSPIGGPFECWTFKNIEFQDKTDVIDLAEGNKKITKVHDYYTSKYNAKFDHDWYDEATTDNAYKKVNDIAWTSRGELPDNETTMAIHGICITKNHVVVRNGGNHTVLSKALYHEYGEDGNIANVNPINVNDFAEIGTSGDGEAKTLFGCGSSMVDANYADLTKYYKMQIKGTPGAELRIIANRKNGSDITKFVRLDSKGLANLDIAEIVKTSSDRFYHLNAIKTPRGYTGNAKIDYIKLYSDEDAIANLDRWMFRTWTHDDNATVTRVHALFGTGEFVGHIGDNNEIASNGVIFGPSNGNVVFSDYAELTGYKAIKITGTAGMAPQLVFNKPFNMTGDYTTNGCVTMTQVLVEGQDGKATATYDISNMQYCHLNTIINNSGASGLIEKIELIADERVDYILEGNGTLSTTDETAADWNHGGKNGNYGTNASAALQDVGARVIDARPRVNNSTTDLEYPGNPNCFIMQRSNLTKTQLNTRQFNAPSKDGVAANMITIAPNANPTSTPLVYEGGNVNIFDGFPFSAPRDINVNSAKLTRKTTENVVGTLILPFACNKLNGKAYKTFGAEYAKYKTDGQGILESTTIMPGDHVLMFEETSEVLPYTPYLYVASASKDNVEFVAANTTIILKTPELRDENGDPTMTNNYDLTGDDVNKEDIHYLRGFMESTHVEDVYGYTSTGACLWAKNATVAPFRVMIQSPIDINQDHLNVQPTGNVKVILSSSFKGNEDVTAIESVETLNPESNVDVFSVNGALVKKNVKAADALQSLPKGVYVVGGKKIVK